ncbi:hypothetical protein A4A49_59798 [Nicotiana attenuata]|uniref:Uncharacterized protein n=1 Tax=Nicotiana attenuata TaxID=49451 RepID=A0A1J6INK1_NICAT|nr:hypothetical protein A4A49_59798 [Nicotiana attenuata]
MAVCSSIALLQERFKQLERVKEMRQEKELLKILSSSTIITHSIGSDRSFEFDNHHQYERVLSHSYDQYHHHHHHHPITREMHNNIDHHHLQPLNNDKCFPLQNPKPSSDQVSLSLWPEIHLQTMNKSRVSNTSMTEIDGSYSDVDTSLHL